MSTALNKKHALTFVTITVLLDVIGFGIIMPVLPDLLREITGADLAEASRWTGYLLVCYAALQFVFAPILGNLSDRFGRRPVLLASLFVYAVNYLIMGFATTLVLLFIGRIVTGIASATHSTASAFIADVSDPEERAQNFGLLGMAFGIGFIIGPPLGGFLGELDTRMPFYVAAGLAFANCLYGYFVLKETLPAEIRRPFDWRRANPVGALARVNKYPVITGLIVALFVYNIAHHVYPANWNFYTMEKFGWTSGDVGLSMGLVGVCMAFVQGYLIRIVIPRFGAPRVGFFGFFAAAIAYVGIAFAPNDAAVYAWCVVSALAGFVMPAVQGILSNQVAQNEQGELQGILGAFASLGAVFGPLAMTQTFTHFSSGAAPIYFPGAAFLLAGVLTVIAVGIFAVNVRPLIAAESRSQGS